MFVACQCLFGCVSHLYRVISYKTLKKCSELLTQKVKFVKLFLEENLFQDLCRYWNK